jgi:hypothetical protein
LRVKVTVERESAAVFRVTVKGARTTVHTVTVEEDYCRKLTGGKVDAERLVARSFDFLLEREPNTSILSRFDLPVIQRYFPEYERTIGSMLEE